MISKWNTVTADFAQSLFLQYISGDPNLTEQSFEILVPVSFGEDNQVNNEIRIFLTNSLNRKDYLEYDSLTKSLVQFGDLPLDSIDAKYNFVALTSPIKDLKQLGVSSEDLDLGKDFPEDFKKSFEKVLNQAFEGMKKVQVKFYPLIDGFMFDSIWNELILHAKLGMWFYKDQDGNEIFSKEVLRPEETKYLKIKNYTNSEFIDLVNNFVGKK